MIHQALVEQNPEQRDGEREDHHQVSLHGRLPCADGMPSEGDQSGAGCGGGKSDPASSIQAFVGKESRSYGKDYRHGPDHKSGVRDSCQRERP